MSGTASSERTSGLAADVVLCVPYILEQNGFAPLGGLPDDALAHADPQPLDLRGVADLKTHAQIVGALIQEQDGEDLVVDHRSHQVRCAVHQGLQIEGGIQGVGQTHEKLGLQRVHPRQAVSSGASELGR